MGKFGGANVGDIWVVAEIDAEGAKTVLFPNKSFELLTLALAFVVLLAAAEVKHVAAAGVDTDGSLIGLSANSVIQTTNLSNLSGTINEG